MTVKELIERLQEFDENFGVKISCPDCEFDFTFGNSYYDVDPHLEELNKKNVVFL